MEAGYGESRGSDTHCSMTEGEAATEEMFSKWTERKIGWGRKQMYNEDI